MKRDSLDLLRNFWISQEKPRSSGFPKERVKDALADIPAFYGGLFPPERQRLLHCLLEEVVVRKDGIDIEFKTAGMKELIEGMTGHDDKKNG